MSYLILGSGGLGIALAHELARRGDEWLLAGRQLPRGLDPACYFPLQEVDPLSFEALFTLYDGDSLPTVVINTIGLLHDLAHMPERRVEEVEPGLGMDVGWADQEVEPGPGVPGPEGERRAERRSRRRSVGPKAMGLGKRIGGRMGAWPKPRSRRARSWEEGVG